MRFRKSLVLQFIIAFTCTVFFSTFVATDSSADEQKATETKDDKKASDEEFEFNEKELAFKDLLTQAKLVGKFTITGRDTDKLEAEEYTITRVNKTAQKDLWVFMARIKYGKNDYTVPLTLEVKWADDTPMITLSDLTIMGQGPFSARVLFHNNKYAGTWSHGKVGGHLFGEVKRASDEKKKDEKESAQ